MASSLMTGLAYGIGGLMTPLTGMLADYFSIQLRYSRLEAAPTRLTPYSCNKVSLKPLAQT